MARFEPLVRVAQAGMPVLLKAEAVEKIAARCNYLLVVDPDVAAAG